MRILIATPARQRVTQGNQVTALRWGRLIEEIGHDVTIACEPDIDRLQGLGARVVIALHATRNWPTIDLCRRHLPQSTIIVLMTGTDLNVDLAVEDKQNPAYQSAMQSLEHAKHIVLLEPAAVELLRQVDPRFADKAFVITQSAQTAPSIEVSDSLPPVLLDFDTFKVAVVGHLRAVKDPMATAEAARLLPADSKVRVIQWGAALEEDYRKRAELETAQNDRYQWLGAVNHRQSLQQLKKCDLMVLSSHFEGGPAVLSEAIVNGVPIIAHQIGATRGLLGDDYPGFYHSADRRQLADLILKAERDANFLRLLRNWAARLKQQFCESSEKLAIKNLLAEVSDISVN